MKTILIAGLGNPRREYEQTRHNIGFRVLDALRKDILQAPDFHTDRDADITDFLWVRTKIILLKPRTFMNESGRPIARLVSFYHLPLEHLWIVHDDLDLPFGELRDAFDRGPAGHQGVQSVIDGLGSQAFHRLRIGIGSNREHDLPSEDYVLQRFTADEENRLLGGSGVINIAATRLWELASHSTDAT